MAGNREISDKYKEDDRNGIKSKYSTSDKTICGIQGDEGEIQHKSFIKRYQRYDLLSLRNAHLSIHYPHCALCPELQALSIWTCRLRCELQYLGLWKVPNTGNTYGNCSCNGNCQSYACDTQPYPSSNFQANTVNAQLCYGNVQQSQQPPPLHTTSSPTLSSKKAARSRERFLNYQRCINTDLIRVASPSGVNEGSTQQNLNHQVKPSSIDHRSISSSHLMPAFAKRRMSHVQSDVASNFNTNDGQSTEQLSNDDKPCDSSTYFETSVKSRRDSLKTANNQNDYHLYKASAYSRLDRSDQSADNQSGSINIVKKINSDFLPSNKVNNTGSANKKLTLERRIGSGRLVPRDVDWDIKTDNNKQIEKENTNIENSIREKDKDISTGEINKLNARNSSIGRYLDPRPQERRIYDRRISNSEEPNNGGNTNTDKKYATTCLGEERNSFDSNYKQPTQHFTGQRSMSFRRREYAEQKEHHRDFLEPKSLREGRENGKQKGDQHHRHNYHRDHKEEPEWFSEGPTSQHDTIELRGFEETDEYHHQEHTRSDQYPNMERNSSESSLLSHNSSSNVNLSIKNNFDTCIKELNNSHNTEAALDTKIDNDSGCNNTKKIKTPNEELTDANESKVDKQIVSATDDVKSLHKLPPNVTEIFFDNFLNLEALENNSIASKNDPSIPASGCGTSRFSRWFFNNSNNNQNSFDELNNNPPNKEDSKRHSKDLNVSDYNSFISFLKCNNFATPELPKGLPSNVSPLSVEELEARMRKMDSDEIEKTNCGGKNLHNNEGNQTKKSECGTVTDLSPQSTEINTEDVEAFQKLLDQLGKPRADVSMNSVLPNSSGPAQSLAAHVGPHPVCLSPIPPSNSSSQSNISKQEYMHNFMHQQQQITHHQQNMCKIVTPLLQQHNSHHRIMQISPQQQPGNSPVMSIPQHPQSHHMSVLMGHTQKRLDVQHLVQSVVREELSRSFLERELKNPNIPPYTKEIISTVLKETSQYNLTLAGGQNVSESTETTSNSDIFNTSSNPMQYMPTQRELQVHTQTIMQNALFKKKIEAGHHDAIRRRQEIHKHQELESPTISQQHQQQSVNSNASISQQVCQQSSRQINSPTPLAFTPTSVLRKMTAEKETIPNSTQATKNASSPQQIQPHFQQPHLKIFTHSQISYQHLNQPRMILGGGNLQYMRQHQVTPAANCSPQISPEQKFQIRNQPPLKWPLIHPLLESNNSVVNNISNKPMGRPILKGPVPIQPLVAQNANNPIQQNLSNIKQNSQSIQTASQMQKYPPIQQQPRQIVGQQFATHIMQSQIPSPQQNTVQQQLFQQQRSVVMQRHQMQQNDLVNNTSMTPTAHHMTCNDNNSVNILNYQRDGGLSPTSNQLAQWFSPELLAQATAGKLPLLNMNQALSLEEFEKSIQHSSTAVNN